MVRDNDLKPCPIPWYAKSAEDPKEIRKLKKTIIFTISEVLPGNTWLESIMQNTSDIG